MPSMALRQRASQYLAMTDVPEIQADRALGMTRRAGGVAVNRPSLWRSSRQPSSCTIR
jgi:hypothetical protein